MRFRLVETADEDFKMLKNYFKKFYPAVLSGNTKKFNYIKQLLDRGLIKLSFTFKDVESPTGEHKKSLYLYPSLYQIKSFDDFKYIVNAYAIFSNKGYASKYLKDTSVIDLKGFTDGDRVKSVDEIKKLVAEWYMKSGSPVSDNDSSGKYSLADIMKKHSSEKDASISNQAKFLSRLLSKWISNPRVDDKVKKAYLEDLKNICDNQLNIKRLGDDFAKYVDYLKEALFSQKAKPFSSDSDAVTIYKDLVNVCKSFKGTIPDVGGTK